MNNSIVVIESGWIMVGEMTNPSTQTTLLKNASREIRKLDRKLGQQCDRVIIYHKNENDSDIRYPNKEGLS